VSSRCGLSQSGDYCDILHYFDMRSCLSTCRGTAYAMRVRTDQTGPVACPAMSAGYLGRRGRQVPAGNDCLSVAGRGQHVHEEFARGWRFDRNRRDR